MDSGLADPLRHVGSCNWHLACNWKVFCDNYLVRLEVRQPPRRATHLLDRSSPATRIVDLCFNTRNLDARLLLPSALPANAEEYVARQR